MFQFTSTNYFVFTFTQSRFFGGELLFWVVGQMFCHLRVMYFNVRVTYILLYGNISLPPQLPICGSNVSCKIYIFYFGLYNEIKKMD